MSNVEDPKQIADDSESESSKILGVYQRGKALTYEEILSPRFPYDFNPHDLIATLDEHAQRRLIDSGITVRALLDEDYIFGLEDLFNVVWTEHPDSHQGHNAEFFCPHCKTLIIGEHDEFGQLRDFYTVDNMDLQGTPICSTCVLEYLQPEWLHALAPATSLLLAKELEELQRYTKEAIESTHDQTIALNGSELVDRRCGFGEDEDVHAHALASTAKPRFSHATAFDLFGAWLLTSDRTAVIMAPQANVPSGETDFGYLRDIASKLRARSDEFMDCGEWLELLEQIVEGSLIIGYEPDVFMMTSMNRVISDHSDFDSPTYDAQPAEWIQA